MCVSQESTAGGVRDIIHCIMLQGLSGQGKFPCGMLARRVYSGYQRYHLLCHVIVFGCLNMANSHGACQPGEYSWRCWRYDCIMLQGLSVCMDKASSPLVCQPGEYSQIKYSCRRQRYHSLCHVECLDKASSPVVCQPGDHTLGVRDLIDCIMLQGLGVWAKRVPPWHAGQQSTA